MKFKSRAKLSAFVFVSAVLGATALSGLCVSEAAQVTLFDDAVVLPTQQETQVAISETGQRIARARLASFDSPVADSDYLAAQRDYDFGRYDQAVANAQAAEQALPEIPNWIER